MVGCIVSPIVSVPYFIIYNINQQRSIVIELHYANKNIVYHLQYCIAV